MKTKIKTGNQTRNIDQLITGLQNGEILTLNEMRYVYGGDGDGGGGIIIIPPPPGDDGD